MIKEQGTMLSTKELKKINVAVRRFIKTPKSSKVFIKTHVKIWSQGEDDTRVLAVMNLVKAIRLSSAIFDPVVKQLYKNFIINTKHVNALNLPFIRFMQRSFCEILSLNVRAAYQHAFVYMRQLGITLRKAYVCPVDHKKKKSYLTVYNWQFINCLGFWCQFIAMKASEDEAIRSLVHPLIQLISGTIKLRPTARYLPLRLHCVHMFNTLAGLISPVELTQDTDSASKFTADKKLLTPSLYYLIEVFQMVDFNKKPKFANGQSAKKKRVKGVKPRSFSKNFSGNFLDTKPLNFYIMLYCSKSQIDGPSFVDAVLDFVYQSLMETVVINANSIAFPEWSMTLLQKLKDTSIKCANKMHSMPMKHLITAMKENCSYICKERRKFVGSLADSEAVELFEAGLVPPFFQFYSTYKVARSAELKRMIENSTEKGESEDNASDDE